MRHSIQPSCRCGAWALSLLVVLWVGLAISPGASAGIGAAARSLEPGLRDLSAWLTDAAPARPPQKPVTMGLRN